MGFVGLNDEDICLLNKQIKLKNLVFPENASIFDLVLFVSSSINNSLLLNLISKNFNKLDNDIISNELFFRISELLRDKFQEARESDYRIKKSTIDFLLIKLLVVIKVLYTNYSEEEKYNFVDRIFNSRIGYSNYELLFRILCNDQIISDTKKRDIIIDNVFNGVVVSDRLYGDYSMFFNFITKKEIFKDSDDESFNKIAKISITNYLTKYLETLYSDDKVSDKKRNIVIEYYVKLLDSLNDVIYVYDDPSVILSKNIFSIPFRDNLISLSNEEYEKELSDILNSNNSEAYSLLLSCNISDDKKNFVKELIDELGHKMYFGVLDDNDSCFKLVKLAISSNIRNMQFGIFKKVMKLLKKLDLKEDDLIFKLITDNDYFNGKSTRLLFVISTMCDDNNKLVIEEIYKFCSNYCSVSFNDQEYKFIINMIINSESEERSRLVNLFTSNKVFRMTYEEKKKMLEDYIESTKDDDEDDCASKDSKNNRRPSVKLIKQVPKKNNLF